MLPRLTGIRIVGVRYAGDTICHEDTFLDFTTEGGLRYPTLPSNVVLPFRNGGGKGVMLQLMMQPLSPLTSWKNGKNKVEHFFWNNEKKSIKYTFHVVLEFEIDQIRRLVTGITVTPRAVSKDMTKEGSSSIDLEYMLFVAERTIEEHDLALENLPLWDIDIRRATSLEDWKNSIKKDYPTRIREYNKYEEQRYMELLSEYGILQSTVQAMLQINANENDMSEFFKGATDNHGLFYKKFIPFANTSIEASTQTTEKLDIAESFIDVLKIAQELPRLLQISEAAHALKTTIDPLIDSVTSMIKIEKQVENHAEKGYSIRENLREQQSQLFDQLNDIKNKITLYKNEIKNAEWKQKNVEYLELFRNTQSLKSDILEQELKISHLDNENKNMEREKSGLNLGILRKNHTETSEFIEETRKVLDNLLSDLDTDDLFLKLDKVKSLLKINWEMQTKPSWQNTVNGSSFLLKEQQKDIDSMELAKTEVLKAISSLNEVYKTTKNAVVKFEENQNDMAKRFGEIIRLSPEDLHLDKEIELRLKGEELLEIEMFKKTNDAQLLYLTANIGGAEKEAELLMLELEENDAEYVQCISEEEEIIGQISDSLKFNLDISSTNRQWFEGQRNILLEKLKREKNILDAKTRMLWKSESDLELMEEGKRINGRIPNYQLLSVKKNIMNQGIPCLLGSEFLGSLSVDARENELERNPVLPYSILLLEDDFEKVDFAFFDHELMELPVFILPRERLSKQSAYPLDKLGLRQFNDSAYVPQDEGVQMWLDNDLWESWIKKVVDAHTNVEFDVILIENTIAKFEQLIKKIENLLLKGTSDEHVLKIEKNKLKLEGIKDSIAEWKFNKEGLIEKDEIFILQMLEKQKAIRQLEDDQLVIKAWLKDCLVYKQNKIYLESLIKKVELEEENSRLIQLELVRVRGIRDAFNNAYIAWSTNVKSQIQILQKVIQDVYYPISDDRYVGNDILPNFEIVLGVEAISLLEQYQELMHEQTNMSAQIALMQSDLNRYQTQIQQLETELYSLDGEWQIQAIPTKTIQQMKQDKETIQSRIVELIIESSSLKGSKDEKEKTLNNLEAKLRLAESDFIQAGYTIEFWEEFDYQILRNTINEKKKHYEKLVKENTLEEERVKEKNNTILYLMDSLREEFVKTSLYQLETEQLRELIRDPRAYLKGWSDEKFNLDNALKKYHMEKVSAFNEIAELIKNNKAINILVKQPLLDELRNLRHLTDNNQDILEMLRNIKSWAIAEADDQLIHQQKAEDAIKFWSERVSRRVVSVINVIKATIGKMKVKNTNGQFVELVRFKRANFPENRSEIESTVKSYCANLIHELMGEYHDVEKIPKAIVTKRINISEIVYKVLGGFPRIQFYIPDATGNFLKEPVKQHLYKDWEVILNGSDKESSKSGGQTLMAQIIMMVMLLKLQKYDDSPGLLITDNMFGVMSSPELLEPVFVALELLKVQWITVCPPTIKIDITSRFNTIYSFDILASQGKNVVTQKVQKYERRYLDLLSAIETSRRYEGDENMENVIS